MRNPYLMQQIRFREQGAAEPGVIERSSGSTIAGEETEFKNQLRIFHDELLEEYRVIMSGDRNALFKMKEIWSYMGELFEDGEKSLKKIKKANYLADYKIAVNELFFLNLKRF